MNYQTPADVTQRAQTTIEINKIPTTNKTQKLVTQFSDILPTPSDNLPKIDHPLTLKVMSLQHNTCLQNSSYNRDSRRA